MELKKYIRDIPDFPKKGILFHDVTTLFKNYEAYNYVLEKFKEKYQEMKIDYVAGIDARGFIIGGTIASILKCGFIPIRKPGKLPAEVLSEEYQLEYGTDTVEIHSDALQKGDRIIVVDDLVATGGTLLAGVKLVERLGGVVVGVGTIIDMPDLGGREKLKDYDFFKLVEYSGK